jgi:protein-tyrosine phosphatase
VFVVVFVCSGNQARSPLAEALLRRRLGDAPVSVSSYGTLDVGRRPPLSSVLAIAPSLGVSLDEHRSRVLTRGVVRNADLVVGFEPHHLDAAIRIGGASPDRTFMFLELPGLVEDLPEPHGLSGVERDRRLVAAMSKRRARIQTPSRSLADPVGESAQVVGEVARQIDAITSMLASLLLHARVR